MSGATTIPMEAFDGNEVVPFGVRIKKEGPSPENLTAVRINVKNSDVALGEIQGFVVNGETRDALDRVVSYVYGQIKSGRHEYCNDLLEKVEINSFPDSVNVAFLASTFPVKSSLPAWTYFANNLKTNLQQKYGSARASKILQGLI